MAQEVGYFENDVIYTEGPFVICNPLGNGWRIEQDYGTRCPGIADPVLVRAACIALAVPLPKWNSKEIATKVCDFLNHNNPKG